MSGLPNQFELDDELLSAYIDDELAPADRAAVDARLAADSAARQLLHELRLVAQSIHALPTAVVARDLSETIIRRALEIKPQASAVRGSPDPALPADRRSPSISDALAKIPAFRTRRSWIWASLALAAGLLIIVLQPGHESNKELPAVAQ